VAIDYQPKFQHVDWIDNFDRVQAAGENGFNRHFHDLEDEFKEISKVVADVKTAIDQLSAQPAAEEETLTLPPVLVTITDPWEQQPGSVRKPGAATAARGVMPVSVEHAHRIRSLRVMGENGGSGVLVVALRRHGLTQGSAAELVVSVGGSGGAFDVTTAAPGTDVAKIDNTRFRYYVEARLQGAAAADVVRLDVFQITHIAE
jgi:hypothetical protein